MTPSPLQPQAPPESITLYSDRRRVLLLLLSTLALVAASAFLVRTQHATFFLITGCIGVVFSTAVSIAILRIFLDLTPRIILDEDGLFDRTMRTPKIPWHTILSIELRSLRGTTVICLELTDEDDRIQALPPLKRLTVTANRSMGFKTFSVNPSALPLSAEEIFRLIASYVKIYGHKRGL
jgi:hypothetical protein